MLVLCVCIGSSYLGLKHLLGGRFGISEVDSSAYRAEKFGESIHCVLAKF